MHIIEAPDSFLYWSVSDNLFQNGHFIGNYYIEIPDFIVPFGLPVILMLLKLIINEAAFVVKLQGSRRMDSVGKLFFLLGLSGK